MTSTARGTLVSLADIARLARVQRPVVSMWRKRPTARGVIIPFPQPKATRDAHDVFDLAEVLDWLEQTGRGKNVEARGEAPLVLSHVTSDGDRGEAAALEAVVVLGAMSGRLLSDMAAHDILDLADELDTAAEVIAELIAMAREVADEADRGKAFDPPLGEDELAFYDAVSENQSAREVMGEQVLAGIAPDKADSPLHPASPAFPRDLPAVGRRDTKPDWTERDDVRAKLRASIKRLLVLHRYPPDQQAEAIRLVIEQMESIAPRYAEGMNP